MYTNDIKYYIKNSLSVKQAFLEDERLVGALNSLAVAIIEVYSSGGKVLVAGNGGSAADAQHFAAELVARFLFERPALDAIALTTNTSVLTAIGNDYSFEDIFSRQIYANGNRGDIFVGISTSGNSPDILKAISAAREKGLKIAALIGGKPSKIDDMADYVIKVPSTVTPHVQEMHITIIHLLCLIIEKTLFSRQKD